jgi:hypothetical protein
MAAEGLFFLAAAGKRPATGRPQKELGSVHKTASFAAYDLATEPKMTEFHRAHPPPDSSLQASRWAWELPAE